MTFLPLQRTAASDFFLIILLEAAAITDLRWA